MASYLWIYSSKETMSRTASSLILFGAEIFFTAKIIKDVDELESINNNINDRGYEDSGLHKFIMVHLIDTIKILIFFENYMKAELIINGFCVHKINKDIPEFKDLAKIQYRKPIKIKEISDLKNFDIDELKESITHNALKPITIGMNDLLSSEDYISNYQLEKSMILILKNLIKYRNNLHFVDSINFFLSTQLIKDIRELKKFVENTISNRIYKPDTDANSG